jgi:hypothetical protein
VLGRSPYATVYEAHDRKSGDRVPVKVLSLAGSHREIVEAMFRKEVDALDGFEHPAVVLLRGRFTEPDAERLGIVLELVPGGRTLEQVIADVRAGKETRRPLRWRIELRRLRARTSKRSSAASTAGRRRGCAAATTSTSDRSRAAPTSRLRKARSMRAPPSPWSRERRDAAARGRPGCAQGRRRAHRQARGCRRARRFQRARGRPHRRGRRFRPRTIVPLWSATALVARALLQEDGISQHIRNTNRI